MGFDRLGTDFSNEDELPSPDSELAIEQFAGLITASDLIAFSQFRVGYSFFGANADVIDQIRRGGVDGTLSRPDLERFIDEAEAAGTTADTIAIMRTIVDAGFFDDPFDLDEVRSLLQGLGITFAVGTGTLILVGAPTALVGLFAVAAAASDVGAISINIADRRIG